MDGKNAGSRGHIRNEIVFVNAKKSLASLKKQVALSPLDVKGSHMKCLKGIVESESNNLTQNVASVFVNVDYILHQRGRFQEHQFASAVSVKEGRGRKNARSASLELIHTWSGSLG